MASDTSIDRIKALLPMRLAQLCSDALVQFSPDVFTVETFRRNASGIGAADGAYVDFSFDLTPAAKKQGLTPILAARKRAGLEVLGETLKEKGADVRHEHHSLHIHEENIAGLAALLSVANARFRQSERGH